MSDINICLRMMNCTEWVGGLIYIQNLAVALAALPPEERSRIKLSIAIPYKNKHYAEALRRYVDRVYVERFFDRGYDRIAKWLAAQVTFIPPALLNFHGFDFVYPEVAGARAPYLWGGWIADFQHYHMPQLFSQGEIEARNELYKKMAQNASVVVLSSRMAQEDFGSFFPEQVHRSAVLNFACWLEPEVFQEDPQRYQDKYNLPEGFFLVANQFWKHKDHRVVIEALGLLKAKGISPTVVCTGNTRDYRHPGYFEELTQRIKELGIAEQVRLVGHIPRLDQVQLMRRSLAVIQPSLFEGWSTVVEEARFLGKTLIISDFPVHLEQNPPHSLFFERSNATELANLLTEVIHSSKPGPDLERENCASQENLLRIKQVGRNFLAIVKDVMANR